jgi:hypothetical protein
VKRKVLRKRTQVRHLYLLSEAFQHSILSPFTLQSLGYRYRFLIDTAPAIRRERQGPRKMNKNRNGLGISVDCFGKSLMVTPFHCWDVQIIVFALERLEDVSQQKEFLRYDLAIRMRFSIWALQKEFLLKHLNRFGNLSCLVS